MKKLLYYVALLFAFVSPAKAISLGSVARNINTPVDMVGGFLAVGCLLVGAACLFAALIKYLEHRRSPLAVPISKVVWLLIIGIILLILPFSYLVTGQGIPLSVLWGE